MTAVLRFVERVMRTVQSAQPQPEEALPNWMKHSRPAPPHAGIYCFECGEPLRPDSIACSVCGTGNPINPVLMNRRM